MYNAIGMFLLPKLLDWLFSGLLIIMLLFALYGFLKWYRGQTFMSAFFRYGDRVKYRGQKSAAATAAQAEENFTWVQAEQAVGKVHTAGLGIATAATEFVSGVVDRIEHVVEVAHDKLEELDDRLGTDFITEPNSPEFIGMRMAVLGIIEEVRAEETAAGNTDGVRVLNALHEDVRERGQRRV